jgi:hypothetical protein
VYEHWWPQDPQLLASVCRLTQALPHTESPDTEQLTAQCPLPSQVAVAPVIAVVHALPQLPQFAVSVFVLVHTVPQRVGFAVVGH